MSYEDERDLAANLEADAEGSLPEQPQLPAAAEVVAYAATWGDTVDEVAAWLRDHGITDNPNINSRGSITRNCVVAMGLRAHFPALEATATTGYGQWLVGHEGAIIIDDGNRQEHRLLPEPVRELVAIADRHRHRIGDPGPYPFLYAPTPTSE